MKIIQKSRERLFDVMVLKVNRFRWFIEYISEAYFNGRKKYAEHNLMSRSDGLKFYSKIKNITNKK